MSHAPPPAGPKPAARRSKAWRVASLALRTGLLAYVGVAAALLFGQSRIIYHPTREIVATPASAGLAYEDVSLRTNDGLRLAAWYVPATDARGTILFCHGNARNISDRLSSIAVFHRLGYSVLIFDYRGYGRSEGRPTEEGTYRDADAAWDHLVRERGASPRTIVVFGRSLGGAVAAHLADTRPVRALILESTFTTAPDLAADLFPWLPARALTTFDYATLYRVDRIRCPKLIVHSPDDDLIPFEHGRHLFAAAAEPKRFLEITGPHCDGFLRSGTRYTSGLADFLARTAPAGPDATP